MTEDEFQAVCRYPDYDEWRLLLGLLHGALAVTDEAGRAGAPPTEALEEVADYVTRLCLLHGWRLASLAAGPEPMPDDAAALLIAARALAGTELERRTQDDPALFGRLATLWRAALGVVRARGLDLGTLLAHRAERYRGIAPYPERWRPPPTPVAGPSVPFTLRFDREGAEPYRVSIEGTVVTVDAPGAPREQLDLMRNDVAMAAFEANVRALEREGLRAEPECGAELPGILEKVAYYEAPLHELWFEGEQLVAAHIHEADPVSYYDCLAPAARRTQARVGRFNPEEPVPRGVIGIHLLRRVLAHPGARHDQLELQLSISDGFINPVLDWLATTPLARQLKHLTLYLSQDDRHSPIQSEPRPLGAMFPALVTLRATYRSWPMWSAAPFPCLRNLTLVDVPWSSEGPAWQPPLGLLAADAQRQAPKLTHLTLFAHSWESLWESLR